ncbi:unnamed protein product [Urochloa humidicola]
MLRSIAPADPANQATGAQGSSPAWGRRGHPQIAPGVGAMLNLGTATGGSEAEELGPSATEVLARPPACLCHPSLPRAAVPGCLQAAEEVPPPRARERGRGIHAIEDQAGAPPVGKGRAGGR